MAMRCFWPPESSAGLRLEVLRLHAHARGQLLDARAALARRRRPPRRPTARLEDAAGRPGGVERGVGVLEDHLDGAQHLASLRFEHALAQHEVAEAQLAAVGGQQTGDAVGERRLAAARLADQPEDLAGADLER